MPYMKVVISELVQRGIRDDYIVMVGGAPLNEEFGKAIGADAYCRDVGGRRRDGPEADRCQARGCLTAAPAAAASSSSAVARSGASSWR